MQIRTLTASDAGRYRELMLEAYTLAPDAFTSTVEERAREPESWWIKRIADPTRLTIAFGFELDGQLAGTAALENWSKPKTKHAALHQPRPVKTAPTCCAGTAHPLRTARW